MQGRSDSLIAIGNSLEVEMYCKAKEYGEKTNPRQGGQCQGQDRSNSLAERRSCPSLFMYNVEKVSVLVERSLEKSR